MTKIIYTCRGYYRCTHRNVQGCLATKQVQRSDEDPSIFEITYRGRHTCTQANHMLPPIQPLESNQETKNSSDLQQQQHLPHQENQQQSQELLSNFRRGLKVITEDLDSEKQSFPSFQFPSTSNAKPENQVFSPSMVDNRFMGNFYPSFISPSASATNYFSVSPSRMHHSFGGNQNFQSSESDLTEIISAATSASNSPTVDLDFPFGNVEFDPNFTFDNPGFHS